MDEDESAPEAEHQPHESHVNLLAGVAEATGRTVHEQLPAIHLGGDRFRLLASPGLAYGCAAGDTIRVDEAGRFMVLERGGNVVVHVYPPEPLGARALGALRNWFEPMGGAVEAPDPASFAVVTVPVRAGFGAIEDAMEAWSSVREETKWYFGNVYDDKGNPLGWWDATDGAGS